MDSTVLQRRPADRALGLFSPSDLRSGIVGPTASSEAEPPWPIALARQFRCHKPFPKTGSRVESVTFHDGNKLEEKYICRAGRGSENDGEENCYTTTRTRLRLARLQLELFAEIEPPHVGIVDDIGRPALHQNFAGINDIGSIGQAERLAHIVVDDQDADPAIGQMPHQRLDVADRNRVDARKGLVEQHVIRPGGQCAGDLDAPALAAGQRDRGRLA